MGINHNRTEVVKHLGRNRKVRPKSFFSHESAKKWAEDNKVGKYDLVQLKDGLSTKIRVVVKE